MKRTILLLIILILFSLHPSLDAIAQSWQPLQGGLGLDDIGRVLYADTIIGKLLVGGNTHHANGHLANGLAAWDGASWDTTCAFSSFTGGNQALGINRYQNELYAIGYVDYNLDTNFLGGFARWNGTAWDSVNIAFGFSGVAVSICQYNNLLYMTGLFDSVGGYYSPAIVAWNGTDWVPVGIPNFQSGIPICCVFQNELYIAGNFTDSLGNLKGCAKFDGTNWTEVGVGGGGLIYTMAVYNNELYIGGGDIGPNLNNIVKYDGINFSVVGNDVNSGVSSLKVIDNKLFAVGNFTVAGTVPASHIAVWDGNTWSAFSNDIFNNGIGDIAVFNNELYVTGGFGMINSDTINGIAKYNGWTVGENKVQEKGGVSVYPNPAKATINISLSANPSKDEPLVITDVLGNTVYHQTLNTINTNIDVSGFSNGMYFYRITSDKETMQGKFIKQ